jgi:hypothetical protein
MVLIKNICPIVWDKKSNYIAVMENDNPHLGEIRVRCVATKLIQDLETIAYQKGHSTLANYLRPELRALRDKEFKEMNLQGRPNIKED